MCLRPHERAETMATMSGTLPGVFDWPCRAAAAKVRDFEAQGVAHTPWAMTKTSRVLPEVLDSLYAAAAAKVQALWGSQLRIGRVAQLVESATVGGAPHRHAELVPLLCPPPIVQVTRLLTVIGASVAGSDLRRDFPRTWRTGPAPPGCSLWSLPSTSWVAGFSCRFGQELMTTASNIDRAEDACDHAQCCCTSAKWRSGYTCAGEKELRTTASSIACADGACDDAQWCHAPTKGDGGYSCAGEKGFSTTAGSIDCADGACDDAHWCYAPAQCDGGYSWAGERG